MLGVPLLAGDDPVWLVKTVLIGLVVALSVVSYHLVEQPFRRGRVPGSRGRIALVLWPVSIGAVVVSTLGVTQYQQELLERRTQAAEAYYDELGLGSSEGAAPTELVEEAVALAEEDAPIHFPLANYEGLRDDHWAEFYACYATFTDTTSPSCELGDPDADVTVVALGDSHMGMWIPALDLIGQNDGFRLVPFVKWACPSIDVPTSSARDDGTCEEFRAWTLEQVRQMDPDVILLSNRVFPPNLDAEDGELDAVWRDGLRSTLAQMYEITDEVRLFGDIPRVAVDPGECLSQDDSSMATCTPDASQRSVKGIVATRAVADDLDVPFVNVAPFTCFEKRCPLVVDRTVTYRDDDHVSVTWARRLAGELRERLELPDFS